ncbi:MAG TPA: iron-containing redox enzyme family protein [Polyangiaceae bacterium]|nr:iron-containing redox enzyme family protein [Polyangiaceae bacterium]
MDWEQRMKHEVAFRVLEGHFIERERVAALHVAVGAPDDPDAFVRWFETLRSIGPGQNDPLFPWLAEKATLSQMKWFLRQEVGGEAGFDDLVALTQVRLPVVAKLELARNYWDEMGQGHESGMHGPMLDHLASSMELPDHDVVWESLALGNLMLGLAANRHYAYQSLGALGVVELTAPARAVCVNDGLKRLGVAGDVRRYFALHATLDVRHSETWNRDVLRPLVASNPRVARPIAEGAWMRLTAGARCFERYRRELGVPALAAARPNRLVAQR